MLLKYPVPDQPHGPPTFVEDAIYLRENFNPAGARKIIMTYSGKTPPHYASTSRPTTPAGMSSGFDQKMSRRRPSLPSPAKFLQHQGGVEALLQGAAKGVFERGERLGINKAVRDAVGEVKRNMQNLQTPSPPKIRKSQDIGSKVNPSIRKSVALMEQRNKQLSEMLDDALIDLRNLSTPEGGTPSKFTDAIECAISKLQYVQVYMEDSSLPLPTKTSQIAAATKSRENFNSVSNTPQVNKDLDREKEDSSAKTTTSADSVAQPRTIGLSEGPNTNLPPPLDMPHFSIIPPELSKVGPAIPSRPHAPIPTRSTLAQSSFAFMLEPDESSASTTKSSSPKASSPFLASAKRPLGGGSREKAFLFGGEIKDGEQSLWKPSEQKSADEEFNLGTIRGSKGQ